MRANEGVFVDTGAWIAMALSKDAYHERAVEIWESLRARGARLHTSVPVILETFTFLDRCTRRDVALAWKDSLARLDRLRILECTSREMERAWPYFQRRDLHKLSAVDATSFVLMTKAKLRVAFTFDQHFLVAGYRMATA